MFYQMPNRLTFISLFLLLPVFLICQRDYKAELRPIADIDVLRLPPLNNSILKKQNQSKSQALRFAEQRAVNLTLKKNGTFQYLKNGKLVWRQRILSPNAYSINLGFTQFKLVEGVELYLYNSDESEMVGPFTSKDNDDHLQLWTPMIMGEEIVIELVGVEKAIKKSELILSSVNHDFLDIKNKSLSGSCNLDVVCGNEDGWGIVDEYRDIISSVGAYTLNGIDQCSGMLINNTAQDCKPYFITADHCEISPSNAQSVVVYWNFENQSCRQPFSFESGQVGNGLRNDFNTGAVLRASLDDSDFALIELDDPVDPRLNLFFSGWDITGELSDTSICIHHPGVEEKRISFDFESMVYESGNVQTPLVIVNDWDIGTTEPGSSGAPIFNSQKRFIGQLNGGLAACGNDEYDAFGYINYSWDANSLPSRSLKSWLDPLSKGIEVLDGIKCAFNLQLSSAEIEVCNETTDEVTIEIVPSEFFTGEITYSISEIPDELNASFLFDKGTKFDQNALTINGFQGLAEGEYSMAIEARDGNNSAEEVITFFISSSVPEPPIQSSPSNGAVDLLSSATLELRRSDIDDFEFEVALDKDFQTVVYQGISNERTFNVTNLKGNEEFFWRAKAINVCGASDWSTIFSFITAPSFCSRFYYDGAAVEIPANASEVIRTSIDINYPVKIQDVNVSNIKGTHSYLEDLVFSLSFNSVETTLTREVCGELDDFDFGFDDESILQQIECPPTNGKIYKPNDSLGNYIDQIAGGTWDLLIEDLADFDGGYLESWSMEVCFNSAEAAVIVPNDHIRSYCESQDIELSCFFDTNGEDSFTIDVTDRNGNTILNQFYINQNEPDQAFISIKTEDLLEESNIVQILLKNEDNGEILAFSQMILNNKGIQQEVIISSPTANQLYALDDDLSIEWDMVFNGESKMEIATDTFFQNIIYSQTVSQKNSLSLPAGIIDPGVYYVRITNTYDCGIVNSAVVKFRVDDDTHVTNNPLLSIKIYPNPSQGVFYIQIDDSFEQQTALALYDVTGRSYAPNLEYVSTGLVKMNLEDFNEGIYILKIRKEESTIQRKIYKMD